MNPLPEGLGVPSELQQQWLRDYPTISAWLTHVYERAFVENAYGDAWLLPFLEEKKLATPGGYHTPKVVAATLYSSLGEVGLRRTKEDFTVPLQITIQGISYNIANEGAPVYYVSEKFIRAVAATELPADIRLTEINWPRKAMVIGFPVDFMKEYLGLDVCYVFAAQRDAGDHQCRFLPNAPAVQTPRPQISWYWTTHSNLGMEYFVSCYYQDDTVGATVRDYTYTDYTNASTEAIKSNHEATDKVSALMLKLLCVLNWRDGLITTGHCLREEKVKKGIKRRALWSPNMIGERYVPQQEKGEPTGPHASPKVHWRRGHSTWQVIGSRADLLPISALPRTQTGDIDWTTAGEEVRTKFMASHRRTWIDPVIVGITP